MHQLRQIAYLGIKDYHTTTIIEKISRERDGGPSCSPETEAMLADWSVITKRKGNKRTTKNHPQEAKPKNSVDGMSDDELERIIIRLQGAAASVETPAPVSKDGVTPAQEERFKKYKHHQFVRRWGLFSDSEGLDEEWYLPSPQALPDDDPGFLCDMCRQIDFETLFTQRGLPGNQQPGECSIRIFGLGKAMKSTHCAFCSLLRRKITQDNLLASLSEEEIEDGSFLLNVLDEGPSRALRLEVELPDVDDERPRFVIQVLAPDNLQQQPLQGLSVSQDVASMPKLKEWLRHCAELHSTSNSSTQKFLEDVPSTLRLVDTIDNCVRKVESPYQYTCLSYVWGTGSQTIKDAMEVTRSVGLRYIWIDALCILQDDDTDKAEIISNMHTIYGNATLTIVASTNSNPMDGIPGISCSRTDAQITGQVQGITLGIVLQDARKRRSEIEESKWNSRAWTFQEKVLSRRAVYFTKSQMYFECPHATMFEDTVPVQDSGYKPLPLNDQTRFSSRQYDIWMRIWTDPTQSRYPNKAFSIDGTTMIMVAEDPSSPGQCSQEPAPVYEFSDAAIAGAMNKQLLEGGTMWDTYRRSVSAYTLRKMSWESDAVNAFLGMTDLIRQGTNTKFWYGMPEFAFHESLLWQPKEPLRRRVMNGKPLFPSWAWAAWDGHVSYRSRGWYNAMRYASLSTLRWFGKLDSQEFIEQWRAQDRTANEVEEMTQKMNGVGTVLQEYSALDLMHLGYKQLGWHVHVNEKRNQHIYTHEAYPGVEFSYPICLPGQPIRDLPDEDGILNIKARKGAARFLDMTNVEPVSSHVQDRFFQLGLRDEDRSANYRRPWQHIIYHQGYRAGFLSLNVPYDELDPDNDKYYLIAVSRDHLSQIEGPDVPWKFYHENDPVTLQRPIFFEEWNEDDVPFPKPNKDVVADTHPRNETGDPFWDEGRFGSVAIIDVYNVLLLREVGGMSERIGVGKINYCAFNAVQPEKELIALC